MTKFFKMEMFRNTDCRFMRRPAGPAFRILVMVAAGFALAGCSKDKSKDPASATPTWKKATISVGNKKYTIDVGRYDRAIPLKMQDASAARRETPLETWNSWQSLSLSGKDDNDLKVYADYYADSKKFLSRLKSPATKFFEDARKSDERPQAIGLIKVDSYTLVVYSVRVASHYRAAVMINKGGKYYIDDDAKFANLVLKELAASGYQVMKKTD